MSSMAKIFVVVNLILAVATFGAAATLLGAQDDYKEAYAAAVEKFETYNDSAEKQIKAANDRANQFEIEKAGAQGDFQSARETNAGLESTLANAHRENTQLRSTNQDYSKQLGVLAGVNKDNLATLQRATNKADEATKAKLESQRELEAEIGNRARLEQEVAAQNDQIKSLSAKQGDLSRNNRRLKFENDQLRKSGGRAIGEGNRGTKGRVNAVRAVGSAVIVSISVGSEDGVRGGDVYHIRRGGEYIGVIKITSVSKGGAVGEFDTKFNNNKGNPESGDEAYPDR